MKTKRFLIFAAGLVLAVIVGCYLFVILKPQTGHLDAGKITAAIHAYSSAMKSENHPLPPTISLQELIAKDFLKHEDVSAFDGWHVTVSLTADETDPQSILMTAQSSDGHKMVVVADGSVQSMKQFMPVAELNPQSETGNQKSAEVVVSVRGLAGAVNCC